MITGGRSLNLFKFHLSLGNIFAPIRPMYLTILLGKVGKELHNSTFNYCEELSTKPLPIRLPHWFRLVVGKIKHSHGQSDCNSFHHIFYQNQKTSKKNIKTSTSPPTVTIDSHSHRSKTFEKKLKVNVQVTKIPMHIIIYPIIQCYGYLRATPPRATHPQEIQPYQGINN